MALQRAFQDVTGARRDQSPSLLENEQDPVPPNSITPFAFTDSAVWYAPRAANRDPRNVRKRQSFFGRSSSDASSMRSGPGLHFAMIDQPSLDTAPHPRPLTAISETRRRKTDPLRSVRDSLFGGRRKFADRNANEPSLSSWSRPSSRDAGAREESESSREHFESESDFYSHRRKLSISPPFDFQHVTHTARDHLPPLETVKERDLPAEFWSTATYQRPRRHLNGIQAEDVGEKLRDMGIVRGSPSSRPTSPIPAELGMYRPRHHGFSGMSGSIDETIREETDDSVLPSGFESHDASQKPHLSRQFPAKFPRRFSSLGALQEQPQPDEPLGSLGSVPIPATHLDLSPTSKPFTFFTESNSSSESELSLNAARRPSQYTFMDPKDSLLTLDSVREESEPPSSRRNSRRIASVYSPDFRQAGDEQSRTIELYTISKRTSCRIPTLLIDTAQREDRSGRGHDPERILSPLAAPSGPPQLPLPPLPPQRMPKTSTPSPNASENTTDGSVLSAISSIDKPPSSQSSRSRRSSRSIKRSPAMLSVVENNRLSTALSDATWEEDVDLAYAQEAESTCEFDWRSATPDYDSSVAESDGGVRLSAWAALPAPSGTSDRSSSALQASQSTDSMIEKPAAAADSARHARASSVGHRGFLAARRGSVEIKRFAAPPALELPSASTQSSTLSPIFSIAETTPRTPFSPTLPGLKEPNATHRSSAEYLSDPESVRTGGSKHRKSSSYGSYESMARPTTYPAARDVTRLSVASATSVPELMRSSRRRSKVSLHKGLISRPLESLPQSPDSSTADGAADGGESSIVPRASRTDPMRNTFILRRSQMGEDGAVVHVVDAGSSRDRLSVPGRHSKVVLVQAERSAVAAASETGWI